MEDFINNCLLVFCMKKEVGYIVSIFGIVVMVVGFGMIPVDWAFLDIIDSNYVAGAGVVLVVIGVFLSMNKGTKRKGHKSGEDELPIFKGVGKERKIVGYRRD